MPILTGRGTGYVSHAGHLWELTPWLAGAADYHVAPTPGKLAAALNMDPVGDFHNIIKRVANQEDRQTLFAEGLDQVEGTCRFLWTKCCSWLVHDKYAQARMVNGSRNRPPRKGPCA